MQKKDAKKRVDYNRVLTPILTFDEFFKKEGDEGDHIRPERTTSASSELKKKHTITPVQTLVEPEAPAPKKSDIIIPPAKIEDPRLIADFDEAINKKRKFQSHYIRIDFTNPLPNADIYEATDQDLQFIKEINEKLPKPSRGSTSNELTMANFEKIIEIWEEANGKNRSIIPLTAAINLLESASIPISKDTIPKVYEYWDNLRKEYERPLLRKNLRAVNELEWCDNTDNLNPIPNPNSAFREREVKKKPNTRRAHKNNDAENLNKMRTLRQDLDMVVSIFGMIKYREMLKTEAYEMEQLEFEGSLKEKLDTAGANKLLDKFKKEYENETYLKQRNKMKNFFDNSSKMIERPNLVPPEPGYEELKFDLGSFLATIIDESLEKEINYEKIQSLLVIEEPIKPVVKPELPVIQQSRPSPRMDSIVQPNVVFQPEMPVTRFERHRSSQPQQVNQGMMQSQIKAPQMPTIEEKNIKKFMLHRRIGRQKRILLDRVFEDEDETSLYTRPAEFYSNGRMEEEALIAPEISSKLPTKNLKDLYVKRFGKFRDICPFNDSGDESEVVEDKLLKNVANNFKAFQRQRRPIGSVV